MTIEFTNIHQSTHSFGAGTVDIDTAFTANLLAIECSTKPEYATTKQTIGTLYQYNGTTQKAYDIKSGKDVIELSLPETTALQFLPTSYLSDNYTLTIGYTNVGAVINGANSVEIPSLLLALPTRVSTLESLDVADATHLANIDTAIAALQTSQTVPSWDALTGKPLTFPPDSHTHAISAVTGLIDTLTTLTSGENANANAVNGLGTRVLALESSSSVAPSWDTLTGKPLTFPPTSHTHSIANIDLLQSDLDAINTALNGKALNSGLTSLTARVTTLESTPPVTSSPVLIYTGSLSQNGIVSIPSCSCILGVYEETSLIGTIVSPQNMTGYTLPPPYVVSASNEYSGTYAAWKAFDGIITGSGTTDYWVTNTIPASLTIDLGATTAVSSYSIYVSAGQLGQHPRTWTFEGSTNGSSWTVLDTRSNISAWGADTGTSFSLISPANYRYYRINITLANGSNVAITQLQLFAVGELIWLLQPVSAYQVNYNNGAYNTVKIQKLSTGTNSPIRVYYL